MSNIKRKLAVCSCAYLALFCLSATSIADQPTLSNGQETGQEPVSTPSSTDDGSQSEVWSQVREFQRSSDPGDPDSQQILLRSWYDGDQRIDLTQLRVSRPDGSRILCSYDVLDGCGDELALLRSLDEKNLGGLLY